MKQRISIILLAAGLLATSASAAEPYVSAFVGDAAMSHVGLGHDKSGLNILAAIGLSFENNVRMETEVGYQTVGNNGEHGSNLDSNMSVLSI